MDPRKEPKHQSPVPSSRAALLQQKKARRRKPYYRMTPEERLPFDIDRVRRYRQTVDTHGDCSGVSDEIRHDVWVYANRVLPALIANGQIFEIRSRLGQPSYADLIMPADGIDYCVAEDLSALTIEEALKKFDQTVLHEWDGYRDNPAVLGTFFINRCSMYFPNGFRQWQGQVNKLEHLGIDPNNSTQATNVWDNPEAVIYDIEFERHIEIIENPIEQQIVRLDSAGATERDIAEILELTEKKVEYRKKKTRAKLRAFWQLEAAADFRGTAAMSA